MSGGETHEVKVLYFDEIRVGRSESFEVTITESMVNAFRVASGDLNPLHVDAAYAKSLGHPSTVVYGMLTASLYSRLVGMYLPGKFSLLHQVEVGFNLPVYVGDALTVSGLVSDVREAVRQIEIKASVSNQNMRKVSVGKIKVGLYA